MESPYHFYNHEWAIDQRSSTPKSSRLTSRSLFHSNESSIMDMEHVNSTGDCTKLKRRLFDEDQSVSGEDRSSKCILVEATLTPTSPSLRKTEQNDPEESSPMLNNMVEDPVELPWTVHQRDAFSDAVKECGGNYGQIAARMKSFLYSRLGHRAHSRSVADVRKRFVEMVRRVSKIMKIKLHDEAYLRYIVINFAEWIRLNPGRKMPQKDRKDPLRLRSLLKELIYNGAAVFPIDQRLPSGEMTAVSQKICTPRARALRQLHWERDLDKMPTAIIIHLRPRTTTSLINVMRSQRSPLLSIKFSPVRTVKTLFDILRRRWNIVRTEKKYLSAEVPDLTLRPPIGISLTWPEIMPDFRVLLGPNHLCWHSYSRFYQQFAHSKSHFASDAKSDRQLYEDDDSDDDEAFYGENDSDGCDYSECGGNKLKEVEQLVFQPEKVYEKYGYQTGRAVWNNARHPDVPLAELYMIAGRDGKLILDYDWIVPDETDMDFTINHFLPTQPNLTFFENLQITAPACLKEEIPGIPDPPPVRSFHLTFSNQATHAPLDIEDITNSPPLSHSSSAGIDSPGMDAGDVDQMPLADMGATESPKMDEGGGTLSEFLVMPTQPSGHEQVNEHVGQGDRSLGTTRGVSVQIPNQFGGTTSALLTFQNQQLYIITDPALLQAESASAKVLGNITLSDLSYLQFGQQQPTTQIQAIRTNFPTPSLCAIAPKSSSQLARARRPEQKPKQPSAPRRPYRALVRPLTSKDA